MYSCFAWEFAHYREDLRPGGPLLVAIKELRSQLGCVLLDWLRWRQRCSGWDQIGMPGQPGEQEGRFWRQGLGFVFGHGVARKDTTLNYRKVLVGRDGNKVAMFCWGRLGRI